MKHLHTIEKGNVSEIARDKIFCLSHSKVSLFEVSQTILKRFKIDNKVLEQWENISKWAPLTAGNDKALFCWLLSFKGIFYIHAEWISHKSLHHFSPARVNMNFMIPQV
jgi:hypothetical protein